MRIRIIDLDAEYEQLSLWWTKRGLAAPPKIILRGAIGFAVNAGMDVAMAWVYIAGTVAFVEWVTSNPSVAMSHRIVDALKGLFDCASEYAKNQGANVIVCGTQDDGSLGRLLASGGWEKCVGEPHQFFVKAIT